MSTLFLTGFPGFLGSALLPRLLEDTEGSAGESGSPDRAEAGEAICVVQPHLSSQARRRLSALERENPGLAGRVELVEGDVTEPGLGVDLPRVTRERIDSVWHLAAVYDLTVDRETGLAVNRDGTRHVVELAGRLPRLARLHYVSTCYVSGATPGVFREDDLDVGQSFNNHYEETKYLAELVVRRAMDEGLPATVYRPAVVTGDSATGATQKYDGLYFAVRLLLRQGSTALMPLPGRPAETCLNVVPRDWVVAAVARLAARSDTVGGTFHLADPDPETIDRIVELLAQATGKRVVRLPLPLGPARWATRWIPGVRQLTGIPAAALDYFAHPTRYATDATQDALDGFAPPPLADYVDALVAFVRDHPEVGSAPGT